MKIYANLAAIQAVRPIYEDVVFVKGDDAPTARGFWQFDANSTATADNITVVNPTQAGNGRWLKV